MSEIRIAVVDDHPLLAAGIAVLFQRTPGFRLVATGARAADVVTIAQSKAVDVIIVDLNMPGDAFKAISEASYNMPDVKFVVFTASGNAEHAVRALEAGAKAFIQKGESADELLDAIERVMANEIYLSPQFAVKMIHLLHQKKRSEADGSSAKLSVRENQIVKLLLKGKQNREIAQVLSLSESTVKAYMSSLMQKMRARNRLEVAIAARKLTEFQTESSDLAWPPRKST